MSAPASMRAAGTGAVAAQRLRRYVAVLVLAIVAAIVLFVGASLVLVRSAFYVRVSTYPYDAIATSRFALDGAYHDVLVIGDSSALRGVVPADVTRETGLATYNAALYAFSGLVSDDLLLRHYLAHNAVPRLVVLYVTPAAPAYDRMQGTYERSFVLFRYGSPHQIAADIAETPGVAFWPEAMLRRYLLPRRHARPGVSSAVTLKEIARNGGYVGTDEKPLGDDCRLDSRADISNKDVLAAFRRKWAARLPDFALYIAPMAACDSAYAYYAAQYRGLADNTIARLPNQDFVDYTHASAAGAHATSRLFADFIEKRRQNWK